MQDRVVGDVGDRPGAAAGVMQLKARDRPIEPNTTPPVE